MVLTIAWYKKAHGHVIGHVIEVNGTILGVVSFKKPSVTGNGLFYLACKEWVRDVNRPGKKNRLTHHYY